MPIRRSRFDYLVLLCLAPSVFCQSSTVSSFPPEPSTTDNLPGPATSIPVAISNLFSGNETAENSTLPLSGKDLPSNTNLEKHSSKTEDSLEIEPLPPVSKLSSDDIPVTLEGGGLTSRLAANESVSNEMFYKDGFLPVTDSSTESHHRSGRKRVEFKEESEVNQSEVTTPCLETGDRKCNMTANSSNANGIDVKNVNVTLKDDNNNVILPATNITGVSQNSTVTGIPDVSSNSSDTKKPRYTLDRAANALSGLQDSVPSPESKYIIPVVVVILVVPLLIALLMFLYRRGADFWERRHYRRMDFLIDGMYND